MPFRLYACDIQLRLKVKLKEMKNPTVLFIPPCCMDKFKEIWNPWTKNLCDNIYSPTFHPTLYITLENGYEY